MVVIFSRNGYLTKNDEKHNQEGCMRPVSITEGDAGASVRHPLCSNV